MQLYTPISLLDGDYGVFQFDDSPRIFVLTSSAFASVGKEMTTRSDMKLLLLLTVDWNLAVLGGEHATPIKVKLSV